MSRGDAASPDIERSHRVGEYSRGPDGGRFAFGANWADFVKTLDADRIAESQAHLADFLGTGLEGASFLDIGSGSGLSSLAAMRLGATRVHSFDYDLDSVGCTAAVRERFLPDADNWTVERGDVLDPDYLSGLGMFDVVYSWGVLHHTGRMWAAIDGAISAVAPGGLLYIAIYNDLGFRTRVWKLIKRVYNRAPQGLRPLLVALCGAPLELRALGGAVLRGQGFAHVRGWGRAGERGMNRWHDLVDWVGGYPYEAAGPGEIFNHCVDRGFSLRSLRTTHTLGCNEFVFVNEAGEGVAT
jgi:2-polyprenyl-6-hydroxyphenyl methylase/3-demethylubiquinone-9 3-methyltransferase